MSKENSYTVIVGCGRLGASIAGRLSEEKKSVIVLDVDKTAFRKLPLSYGGLTSTGNATDMEKLKSINLSEATVFIAVTDDDSVNICAAQIAKKVFNINRVVARIYDEDKIDLVEKMDIDTICPARLSVKELLNYIEDGGEINVG